MQLLERLGRTVETVSGLVPECTGLTVTRTDQEGTHTVAVSDETVAVLDAVQYLEGGPVTVGGVRGRSGLTRLRDLDGRWPLLVGACAHAGVRSILTLPVTEQGLVQGTVQLYAGHDSGFDTDPDELSRLLEEEARAALSDPVSTLPDRRLAERPPVSLRGQGAVNRAIGALSVHLDRDVTAAHERLDDAATRAGIPIEQLALALVELL